MYFISHYCYYVVNEMLMNLNSIIFISPAVFEETSVKTLSYVNPKNIFGLLIYFYDLIPMRNGIN
ncbi:hypothetical protein D3C71_27070 [compost metagenome]